MNRFARQRRS